MSPFIYEKANKGYLIKDSFGNGFELQVTDEANAATLVDGLNRAFLMGAYRSVAFLKHDTDEIYRGLYEPKAPTITDPVRQPATVENPPSTDLNDQDDEWGQLVV